MKNKIILSIVIPVYNEPINIRKTLIRIKKEIRSQSEIIVVYDHDSDTTLPTLKELKKKHQNLIILKNNVLPGPSGAIRTGISKAKAPYILVTMADLCDDLSQVDELIEIAKKGADIVCPSRYCKGGGQEIYTPLKALLPQTAGFLLNSFTGIPTKDPTNSYKLYSRKILDQIVLKSTISFSVTLEIVAKAHCIGAKISEVPTVWRDRQYGKTNFKIGPSLLAYFPWFCLALLNNRLFKVPSAIINAFIR